MAALRGLDYRGKTPHSKGCSANEAAIDIFACEKVLGIVWLDTPAVQNANSRGHAFAPVPANRISDQSVNLVRLLGGGRSSGADGPHRLVGDNCSRDVVGGNLFQGRLQLSENDCLSATALSLGQRFADAYERFEAEV